MRRILGREPCGVLASPSYACAVVLCIAGRARPHQKFGTRFEPPSWTFRSEVKTMYYAGTLQRPRARAPRPVRPASALVSACLACFACALALAQSGRTPPPPAPATPPPGDSRPRQVNAQRRELPPAFIVVTAPPDGSQESSPFVASGYPPTTDFEEIARGGCLVALRNHNGVKRVVGDVDVPRWEARETARGEDEAWVVWLELRWQQN